MRTVFICLLIAVFSMAAIAQQPASSKPATNESQPLPPNAASRDRVLKMFAVLNVKQTAEMAVQSAMQQAKINATQLFQQETPDATQEQINHFSAMMDGVMQDTFSSMNMDAMFEVVIPVYQRHFTNADIDTIVAFYSSSTGQKFLTELPQVMQESMTVMGPLQQQMMQEMSKKMQDRMEKEKEKEKEKQKH